MMMWVQPAENATTLSNSMDSAHVIEYCAQHNGKSTGVAFDPTQL